MKNGELTPVGVAKSIWFSEVKHCALVFCLVAMLLAGYVVESHAKEKNTQQYSKDYKAFPSESPEAVVTSFVEYADLGKNANRQADERYPLFWSLTELSEVPDNSQRLIIKSYKIDGKNTLPSGDVIVRLTMDVRAIALSSCDPKDHSGYKYQKNNCDWRNVLLLSTILQQTVKTE
jgi:hypothetical protein